ncbi:dynamin family protein [Brevibacillus sp. SYP-B805]|uniref:dynamin family protein n=1 Tax=Brevibacillus sp. SYP-B805 TaxID=1578199 RepID=UPI0013ECB368|nr:dynamin family protein [Brevibacillus sp. SYP-B805]NGQ96898.1 dynamin family protein [Brevibacillus sp. SYP-B805]
MNQLKQTLLAAAEKLIKTSEAISGVPGMQGQAKALRERAERLRENRFTVALFGAFSAGKSSFANALMGDLVLPVSPNPTTAAINKIMPPDEQHAHGTVRVVLKSREVLEQDVLRSLAVFEIEAADMESALAAVDQIDVAQIAATVKPHYTFIRAVKKGMPEMAPHIGGELVVDMQAFKGFVAKEEKACFAEFIELYYACPLTDQGIVLVDTPGADSINARHTGVAFEYMKNADAVLFVTYYNHAFAQADREFLLQMGRVKETFELDKMFFLVNAADLAASPEELAGVVAHVEKNLLACGIRFPRIYPVSSQTALLARMHGAGKLSASAEKLYRERTHRTAGEALMPEEEALELSGLSAFERDFRRFTLEELTQMAVDAALGEIRRAHDTLGEWIALAEEGESVRQERRKAAEAMRQEALQLVAGISVAPEERDLAKEREELLYYVKQRLFFRFPELFSHAFNPAVLKEDGRNMKQALQQCLQELLRAVSYDLGQELRATSLRLEKFLNKTGAALVKRWETDLARYLQGATLAPYANRQVETPAFAEELPGTGTAELQAALKLFKNAKDFFELDGKSAMRDALEKALQQPVAHYLAQGGQLLEDRFAAAFAEMVADERQRVTEQVEEYFTGVFAALEMQVDIGDLLTRQKTVASLLA